MNMYRFTLKVKRKLKNLFIYFLFQFPRVLKYKLLSDCKNVIGSPKYNQPTQLVEKGTIIFGKNVNLGVKPSPFLYSGYSYIEARSVVTKSIPKNVIAGGNPAKVIKKIIF